MKRWLIAGGAAALLTVAIAIEVTKKPAPPSPAKVIAPLAVESDSLERLWYFGDGETSTEKNPLHTYRQAGVYDVTLIVRDLRTGLSDTLTKREYIHVYAADPRYPTHPVRGHGQAPTFSGGSDENTDVASDRRADSSGSGSRRLDLHDPSRDWGWYTPAYGAMVPIIH